MEGCYRDVTGVLYLCYRGVMFVLQGCYICGTGLLYFCYRGVIFLLQRYNICVTGMYRFVTDVLQGYYRVVTGCF